MKRNPLVLAAAVAVILASCATPGRDAINARPESNGAAARAIAEVRAKVAPDPHLAIFNIAVHEQGRQVSLRGEVDSPQARDATLATLTRAGFKVRDHITVLPAPEIGAATWGISCLSVANGREKPAHSAELGTQILMGHVVRVWAQSNRWFLVQSADHYLSWVQRGTFAHCTREQVESWQSSPLLLVTAFEDRVLEAPQADAQPVSDVVTGCLLKRAGDVGEWFKVELPDRRCGFLAKSAAVDYAQWKRSRQPTPDAIERTAKTLLGRPYLWGGNSPKGLDCSGFTKLVYFLNGIELDRNASHQARQGLDVPIDGGVRHLKKGDLIFFGSRGRTGTAERVTHVGIYLGDKFFIQSSELVHISSLDPQSPVYDEHWSRTLIRARRVLPGL